MIAAFAFFLLTTYKLKDRPLRWDETEYALQAKGILRHGVPQILFGEDNYVRRYDKESTGYAAHYGLWHPPLYLYVLALHTKFFGDSVASYRMLGLLCSFGTLVILWMICAKVFDAKDFPLLPAGAFVLTLLNPFFIQGILYVDIDTTVMIPLVLLLLYGFIRYPPYERRNVVTLFCLGAIFAVNFWAKWTTPIVTILAVFVYCVVLGKWKEGLKNLFYVAAIGSVIFVISWLAYGRMTGLPIDFPLRFSYLNRLSRLGFGYGHVSILTSVRYFFLYLSLPFAMLALIAVIASMKRVRQSPQTMAYEPQLLLALAGSIIALAYIFWIPTVGKYTVVLVPIFSVLVSGLVTKRFISYVTVNPKVSVILMTFIFIFYLISVGDLVRASPNPEATQLNVQSLLTDERIGRYVLSLVPLLAIAGFLALVHEAEFVGECAVLTLAVVTIPVFISQNIGTLKEGYSPLRPQVERGYLEAVKNLDARCDSGDIVFAPKDMGYYLRRCRVIPTDQAEIYPLYSISDVADLLSCDSKIKWVMESKKYPDSVLLGPARERLKEDFTVDSIVGDFVTYRRVNDGAQNCKG